MANFSVNIKRVYWRSSKELGIILGIFGILLSVFVFPGVVFGFYGFMLSISALILSSKLKLSNKTAILGLILNILALILSWFFYNFWNNKILNDLKNNFNPFYNYYNGQLDSTGHFIDSLNPDFDSLLIDDDKIQNLKHFIQNDDNTPEPAPEE